MSCLLLIAAPDLHSSYGDLVQKYFIAQGLSCEHHVYVVADDAEQFVKDVVWISRRNATPSTSTPGDDDDKVGELDSPKIKIAWRYEQMKQFQTTVSSSPSHLNGEFCRDFDLTSRIPDSVLDVALQTQQLCFISTESTSRERTSTSHVLGQISDILESTGSGQPSPTPVRICIRSLGSPQWGELTDQDILRFLYILRSLLRRYPRACASVSLPPRLSTDSWAGPGWINKLSWLSDAAFTLSAFSANPSLIAMFPSHHGLLHIHSLPAPHSLLPPSDKFSTLRGLSASAAFAGGSGENNLTFKCTRKRLIFETLHLDIEGGIGERRTVPSTVALPANTSSERHDWSVHSDQAKTALAAVDVVLEDVKPENASCQTGHGAVEAAEVLKSKPKKERKKVAFRSDRPDLYDF